MKDNPISLSQLYLLNRLKNQLSEVHSSKGSGDESSKILVPLSVELRFYAQVA